MRVTSVGILVSAVLECVFVCQLLLVVSVLLMVVCIFFFKQKTAYEI